MVTLFGEKDAWPSEAPVAAGLIQIHITGGTDNYAVITAGIPYYGRTENSMPRKNNACFFSLYLSSVMPKWLYLNLICQISKSWWNDESTGRKTTHYCT